MDDDDNNSESSVDDEDYINQQNELYESDKFFKIMDLKFELEQCITFGHLRWISVQELIDIIKTFKYEKTINITITNDQHEGYIDLLELIFEKNLNVCINITQCLHNKLEFLSKLNN